MVRSREYTKQALHLTDRVSEYERAQIAARYYGATGEVYKEIDAWQLSIRTYPRSEVFHNELGLIYIDLGQYEEGLKEGVKGGVKVSHGGGGKGDH